MAVGDWVTGFAEGDRVRPFSPELAGRQAAAARFGRRPRRHAYAIQSASRGESISDHLSYREVACLPCAALTAFTVSIPANAFWSGKAFSPWALAACRSSHPVRQGPQRAGDRDHFRRGQSARLSDLGAADAVIDRNSHPDWEGSFLDLTGGKGVDRVIDTVGPAR